MSCQDATALFRHFPLTFVPHCHDDIHNTDLDSPHHDTTMSSSEFEHTPATSVPSTPSVHSRSATPDNQTTAGQDLKTPKNKNPTPSHDFTPVAPYTGSNSVTGEVSASSGAPVLPPLANVEAAIIQREVGKVYDVTNGDFLRLVFDVDVDDATRVLISNVDALVGMPEYNDKLKAYQDSWVAKGTEQQSEAQTKQPEGEGKPTAGKAKQNEVATYGPFIELCNWTIQYMRQRRSKSFPKVQPHPLFHLVDTHNKVTKGSLTERKPDISGRDPLHSQLKNVDYKSQAPDFDYWSTDTFVEELKDVLIASKRPLPFDISTLREETKKPRTRSAEVDSASEPRSKRTCAQNSPVPGASTHDTLVGSDKTGNDSDDGAWFTGAPEQQNDRAATSEEPSVETDYGDAPPPHGEDGPKDQVLNQHEAQLMGYVLELFDNGVLRNHVISFLVARKNVRIIYADRSIVLTSTFPIQFLGLIIYSMLTLDKAGWGYMMPHNPVNPSEIARHVDTQDRLHLSRFRDCEFHPSSSGKKPYFLIDDVLFSARTLKGRGTKVVTIKPCDGLGQDTLAHIEHWTIEQRTLGPKWLARVSAARDARARRMAEAHQASIPALAQSKPDTSLKDAFARARQQLGHRSPHLHSSLHSQGSQPSKSTDSRTHSTSSASSPASSSHTEATSAQEGDDSSTKAETNNSQDTNHIAYTLSLMDFSIAERVGTAVAKISAIPRRRKKEYFIVRHLRRLASEEDGSYGDHLPLHFAHSTIRHKPSTPQARVFLWAQQANVEYEMRHVEVVVQDLRYPITQIYDVHEMVAAYRDILKVLLWLEKKKVWHRDVSLSNCQFRLVPPSKKHDNRGTVGVLGDFDLALQLDDNHQHTPSAHFRTGTLPFMAIEVLNNPEDNTTFAHCTRFDAESLFYAAYYHFCTFYRDGGLNRKQPLKSWHLSDRKTLRSVKFYLLLSKLTRDDMLPEYHHLVPALNAIRVHIYGAVNGVEQLDASDIDDLDTVNGLFNGVTLLTLFNKFVAAAKQGPP